LDGTGFEAVVGALPKGLLVLLVIGAGDSCIGVLSVPPVAIRGLSVAFLVASSYNTRMVGALTPHP